jgi:hypothetical protein
VVGSPPKNGYKQYQHYLSVDQDGEEISVITERDEKLLQRKKIDPLRNHCDRYGDYFASWLMKQL